VAKHITDIIFDLDGTLIDSAPSILECFKLVLESRKIEPICPLSPDLIGPPLSETLSRITGINEPNVLSKLAEDFKAHYDLGGYKKTVSFFGVSELLRQYSSSGFCLHIATNKRLMPTTLILSHLGWMQYFKSIYALDSASPSFVNKTAMLSALIAAEKINPISAIYIGDRAEDHESAVKNGLNFLGASWGYRDQKLLSNNAIDSCHAIDQFSRYVNI
jgi:phosphoglycolate phosphatase